MAFTPITPGTAFSPDKAMTRSMVVTVLWRLAGEPKVTGKLTFSDVPAGADYADAVRWASANGIAEGYSSGAFGVNDSVTRQQLAVFLYRYAKSQGLDVSAAADISGYADAASVASWAKTELRWANAKGLIGDSGGNRLTPNGYAARAQVAVILMRFIEGSK